jgi:hypothetical protein
MNEALAWQNGVMAALTSVMAEKAPNDGGSGPIYYGDSFYDAGGVYSDGGDDW